MTDLSQRNVASLPVISSDGGCRGWVRLDRDRVGHKSQTEFCITIDTQGAFLSPFEARAFARRLEEAATSAEIHLTLGRTGR